MDDLDCVDPLLFSNKLTFDLHRIKKIEIIYERESCNRAKKKAKEEKVKEDDDESVCMTTAKPFECRLLRNGRCCATAQFFGFFLLVAEQVKENCAFRCRSGIVVASSRVGGGSDDDADDEAADGDGQIESSPDSRWSARRERRREREREREREC
jgi:hypothetical protein